VWVSNDDIVGVGNDEEQYNFRLHPRRWTKIYEKHHKPSQRQYDSLDLSQNPIILKPGQVRAIYIHSTLPGDEAIVYDNSEVISHGRQGHRSRPRVRFQDKCIAVYSGKAHLSNDPFGQTPIWGWGNAWRDRREFVGQIHYGTVYRLWNPDRHLSFGPNFRKAMETMLVLQRRDETTVSRLPDECIYYIMNMCRWDWFDDCTNQMKTEQRLRKRRLREQLRQSHQEAQAQQRQVDESNPTCRTIRSWDNSIIMDEEDDSSPKCETTDDTIMSDAQVLLQQNLFEDDDDGVDEEENDEENESEEDNGDDDDRSLLRDDDDDDDDSEAWEEDHVYRAEDTMFRYFDASSSDEDESTEQDEQRYGMNNTAPRQSWFRNHFPRISVIRALAANRSTVVHMDT
jgi:hypothetical protein